MITPTTTRGRGRPRKQLENPDCEPATRGYVKCLMRKMIGAEHTHNVVGSKQTENIKVALLFMATASFCGWLFGVKMAGVANLEAIFASIFWMSITLYLACAITGPVDVNRGRAFEYIPDCIQLNIDPPCEPKRGCEEQE